jgi:restriction system protein
MARQRTSPLEDVILLASKLPWWACLIMALVSYGVLHAIAARPMIAPVAGPGQLGAAVSHGLITTMAMFGQYVLAFAFCMAAILSAITVFRQKKLYSTVATRPDVAVMNEMSWNEFEMLVGEHFRRQGFQVSRLGGNGPDGGVDLVLKNKSESYLVQCKQWKAYKVGVQPVRELYGVMASRGAAGGYVITSGMFTDEAQAFAKGLNVELIDGRKFRQIIDNVRRPAAAVQQPAVVQAVTPNCPKCGAEMKKRVARQGSNAGNEFWGCSGYPACKGILPITPAIDAAPVLAQETAQVTPVANSRKSCPECGDELVIREFKSGPKVGQQFLGCLQCKKGYPLEQTA